MESVTIPTSDSSMLRKLAELKEGQGWAHHVADAATGELLTTQLPQPVAPLSRVERLSRLGHQFDPSIFGAPTYRLTPRHSYQSSPTGFLSFRRARLVSAYSDEPDGVAVWFSQDIVGENVGIMDALLFEPPQGRCLLTLLLGTFNVPGQVGRIRIEVRTWGAERLVASFRLAVHGDNFIEHTFDLAFVSVPIIPAARLVQMILEPGSGFDFVRFRSLTLAPSFHPVHVLEE
jgi:hypothetical protein